jgi:hypothetical protein
MFTKKAAKKRPRSPSITISSDDDIEEILATASGSLQPAKRHKTATSSSTATPINAQEEEESSEVSDIEDEVEVTTAELVQEARDTNGDAHVDSVAAADDIAEWVDTVLDDAAPLRPEELGALASECLKIARKKKDYRSTVLFAALVDFYRWMHRMGRLGAALRIAKNHGKGPAFQRVVAAQARFFEAYGSLKPSHQGRRQKSNGLLDDEGFYMGVQRWLRTLEVGTVSHLSLARSMQS